MAIDRKTLWWRLWAVWMAWVLWTTWIFAHPFDRSWAQAIAVRHGLPIVLLGQLALAAMGWTGAANVAWPTAVSAEGRRLLTILMLLVLPPISGFLAIAWRCGWIFHCLPDARRALFIMCGVVFGGIALGHGFGKDRNRRRWGTLSAALVYVALGLLSERNAHAWDRSYKPPEARKMRVAAGSILTVVPGGQIVAGGGKLCRIGRPELKNLDGRYQVRWGVEIAFWQPSGWLIPPETSPKWLTPAWIRADAIHEFDGGRHRRKIETLEKKQCGGMFVWTSFAVIDEFKDASKAEWMSMTSTARQQRHDAAHDAVHRWADQAVFTVRMPGRVP